METGKIKFFKPDKGFGFIKRKSGEDIFFHRTDVEGKEELSEGEVEFEIGESPKGPVAKQVRRKKAEGGSIKLNNNGSGPPTTES